MNLLIEIKRHSARRSGISVVEVLSAIVVAMIGVFGVMILIPFAVQQAQGGLDRDEGATVGRNAFEQFEIEGFRFVGYDSATGSNHTTRLRGLAGNNVTVDAPTGVMVVDPLYMAENGSADPFCNFTRFNLVDTNNTPFTSGLARQMCRSTDDLLFKSTLDNPPAGLVEDLAPPQQIFDLASGNAARRQSLGRISWNAVLVPVKADYGQTPTGSGTPGLMFRMHVLTHKNRDLAQGVEYPSATVVTPASGTGHSGGTVTVAWDPLPLNPTITVPDVRRDDWVMLTNSANNTVESGYRNQVGFFRVVGAFSSVQGTTLTLEGPDFGFNSGTKLHHLVGFRNGKRSDHVVNVYERTMRWERKSNWN